MESTIVLLPNFFDRSEIISGFFIAAVFIDILSAPDLKTDLLAAKYVNLDAPTKFSPEIIKQHPLENL